MEENDRTTPPISPCLSAFAGVNVDDRIMNGNEWLGNSDSHLPLWNAPRSSEEHDTRANDPWIANSDGDLPLWDIPRHAGVQSFVVSTNWNESTSRDQFSLSGPVFIKKDPRYFHKQWVTGTIFKAVSPEEMYFLKDLYNKPSQQLRADLNTAYQFIQPFLPNALPEVGECVVSGKDGVFERGEILLVDDLDEEFTIFFFDSGFTRERVPLKDVFPIVQPFGLYPRMLLPVNLTLTTSDPENAAWEWNCKFDELVNSRLHCSQLGEAVDGFFPVLLASPSRVDGRRLISPSDDDDEYPVFEGALNPLINTERNYDLKKNCVFISKDNFIQRDTVNFNSAAVFLHLKPIESPELKYIQDELPKELESSAQKDRKKPIDLWLNCLYACRFTHNEKEVYARAVIREFLDENQLRCFLPDHGFYTIIEPNDVWYLDRYFIEEYRRATFPLVVDEYNFVMKEGDVVDIRGLGKLHRSPSNGYWWTARLVFNVNSNETFMTTDSLS